MAFNTSLSKPGMTAQLSIKQLQYILSLQKGRRNNLKKKALRACLIEAPEYSGSRLGDATILFSAFYV